MPGPGYTSASTSLSWNFDDFGDYNIVTVGYMEVSPLQFEEMWKKKYNGQSYFGAAQAERLERKYREGKARLSRPGAVQ